MKRVGHKHHKKTPFQITIISVIILTIITIITATICVFVFDKKYQVEMKISQLSHEYYENYFYPQLSSRDDDISQSLEHFRDKGFAKVSLRQLILSNPNLSEPEIDTLRKYCNENSTFVQFFPESPYDKASYRTEYIYSCNF